MSSCPECGEAVADGQTTCPNCGHDLAGEDVPPTEGETETAVPEEGSEPALATDGASRRNPAEWTTGRQVTAIGTVVVAIAAFLPWISVEVLGASATEIGIDGDGIITLAFAVLVLLLAVWRWSRGVRLATGILGALTTVLAGLYITDPAWGMDTDGVTGSIENFVSPEIGLYLTAFGGLVIVGGVVWDTVQGR